MSCVVATGNVRTLRCSELELSGGEGEQYLTELTKYTLIRIYDTEAA